MHTETGIETSFNQQGLMRTFGATLTHVGAGEACVAVPYSAALTQQNGFLHAGAITAIADTACGYAAASVAPPGGNPLAVEFKINLLAPAQGERFEARATVLRRGKTLTVSRADVFAITGEEESLVATMLQTTIVRVAAGAERG